MSGYTQANRRRYARLAPLYDLLDWPFEPLYRVGRRLIGRAAAGRTLEIGAGTGKNFGYYQPRSAHVIASDLAWPMLARARQRLRPSVNALLLADAEHLPITEASIDTVVATFVCGVQAEPSSALREIARVLRPGGQVLILDCGTPRRGWVHSVMRILQPTLRSLYGISWQHDLPRALGQCGLRVLEIRPIRGPVIRYIRAASA